MQGKLFVISAPSGAGKTTLKDLVLPQFTGLRYSVSATTRAPRPGEVHGQHYFFYSKKDFEDLIKNQALLEWNLVHGNYYGTPKAFIDQTLANGNNVLLDLDVFGKSNFDLAYPDAVGILILPPSPEELERRLRSRGTESDETIRLRLENSKKETIYALSEGKFSYQIINDNLPSATQKLREILIHHGCS